MREFPHQRPRPKQTKEGNLSGNSGGILSHVQLAPRSSSLPSFLSCRVPRMCKKMIPSLPCNPVTTTRKQQTLSPTHLPPTPPPSGLITLSFTISLHTPPPFTRTHPALSLYRPVSRRNPLPHTSSGCPTEPPLTEHPMVSGIYTPTGRYCAPFPPPPQSQHHKTAVTLFS